MGEQTTQRLLGATLVTSGAALIWCVFGNEAQPELKYRQIELPSYLTTASRHSLPVQTIRQTSDDDRVSSTLGHRLAHDQHAAAVTPMASLMAPPTSKPITDRIIESHDAHLTEPSRDQRALPDPPASVTNDASKVSPQSVPSTGFAAYVRPQAAVANESQLATRAELEPVGPPQQLATPARPLAIDYADLPRVEPAAAQQTPANLASVVHAGFDGELGTRSAQPRRIVNTHATKTHEPNAPSVAPPAQLQEPVSNEVQLDARIDRAAASPLDQHATKQQLTLKSSNATKAQHASSLESLNRPTTVLQANLESTIRAQDKNFGHVDKRVRKVNWAEIELAPTTDPAVAVRPQEEQDLARQRANPQVEARAREHLQYGQSLVRRRAYLAGREEFIRALLLIANSYQTDSVANAYPERFARALTALDEATDLATSGQATGGELRYQQKILSHQSQLIAPADVPTTRLGQAIGIYSGFAQAQIEQAIGFSKTGSEALHALGKMESIAPDATASDARTSQVKALVFFRAALSADPSNAACANDLGVLLFNMGRLEEAEHAIKISLGSAQSKLGWQNLALIHNQRASNANTTEERDHQLLFASKATKEAEEFRMNPRDDRVADGQWATATEFQNNAAFPDTVVQHARERTAAKAPEQGPKKPTSFMKKVKGWF